MAVAQHMKTLMERLQVEDDKLNLELEESHGDYDKMRLIFEKRIDLYKRFLEEEGLTELDRLRLEQKRMDYESPLESNHRKRVTCQNYRPYEACL
ncbi:MAG: hypothetical protein ACRD8W_32515 [Nitrososphaeraceae archaeon]